MNRLDTITSAFTTLQNELDALCDDIEAEANRDDRASSSAHSAAMKAQHEVGLILTEVERVCLRFYALQNTWADRADREREGGHDD